MLRDFCAETRREGARTCGLAGRLLLNVALREAGARAKGCEEEGAPLRGPLSHEDMEAT